MELKKTNETLSEISGKLDKLTFTRTGGSNGSNSKAMSGSPFKSAMESAERTDSGIYVAKGTNGAAKKVNASSRNRAAQNYGNSSTSSNFDFGLGSSSPKPTVSQAKPKLFGPDGKPIL